MVQSVTLRGACHCGDVRFEVDLPDGLTKPRRCTCSMCRMRGAVAVTAKLGGIRFIEGKDRLTEYRFNTGVARHYFCSRCGIYTHHQRRSSPHELSVNAACLEDVSPFDFDAVEVIDGVNHPSDAGRTNGPRIAGVLRFDRTAE